MYALLDLVFQKISVVTNRCK